MKPRFRNSFLLTSITLALFASPAAQAVTYYWDTTSPIEAVGFGSAGGTWGSDADWSASSTGEDITGIAGPLNTDDLNFGTGANVLGAGTVAVTGTQSANSLTFGLGSGAITLSGGTIDLAATATLIVDNTAGVTISSALSGASTSLTKSGGGNLSLSGVNSYTGATSISGGTLTIDDGSIATSSGIVNDAALVYNLSTTPRTYANVISGIGTLAKSGGNTLTLSGANTYTGATTISAGILKLGNIAALGAGTGAVDGTTISAGATLDLGGVSIPTANANAERITVSGAGVGGNGAILSSTVLATPFNGVRFLTLAGDTTLGFSNRWDVGHNTGSGPSSLVGAGFTLNFLGTAAAAQASLNNLGATDLGDINVNLGSVVTTNILYFQGTTDLGRPGNTATITGGSALEIFSNNTNTTFDKKFALNNGVLNVGKAATLPGTISLTTATNTINANAATAASGVISGTGSLIKGGANTLTLSNANTYTGSTTVTNGTLSINSILDVNAGASAVGAPTTALDGTISMGNATTATVLTYTGTGHSSNRVINLAGTTGGVTFNQSGASGLLKFTSPFTATGNGAKTLTLQGSTAGTGEISGAIVNNGTVTTPTTTAAFAAAATKIFVSSTAGYTIGSRITGNGIAATTATTITAINTGTGELTISPAAATAGTLGQTMTITASTGVTKTGTGAWTLSGTNPYTGSTALSGGLLRIDNASALPGGMGSTGGTSYLVFTNGAVLGLGGTGTQPVFARAHGVNLVNGFYFSSNGGFAAFDQDRVVNVGGANANPGWLNGKTIILGHSTATHKVTITNPFNITTVTRPLQVDDGSGAIDGELSGVISHNAGAVAGVDKTGAGTVAFTGNSTFEGSLVVRSGTVVVNKVTNTGTASPIGQGNSGFTLAGGTFQYAPVSAVGGGAATINRNFGIAASSSLDASGTGALVLSNTAIISPDVTGQTGTWPVGANQNITGLSSTANLAIGMRISGAGIPAGAVITQILSSSSITMSGTTTAVGTAAAVSFGYPTARTLTLTGTNSDANTIAGILQDSSALGAGVLSIAKTGAGSWTLTGANTYTGSTTVSAGTLALVGGSQASPITVNNLASLGFTLGSSTTSTSTLNFIAGSTIKITGTPAPATSYTLLTTTATISGTPVLATPIAGFELQIVGGNTLKLVPSSGYSSWATLNGAGANLNDDHDSDGVSNGVEYFIGGPSGNTTGFTPVPGVVNTAGTLSVTWTKAASYTGTYGTNFWVETSASLANPWTNQIADPTPGFTVTFPSATEVKYTFPAGTINFARLKVTGP